MTAAIRTIVSDLYHNRVRGVGPGFGLLASKGEKEWGVLSDNHHIERKASPAKFLLDMKNFSLVVDVDSADNNAANGSVLFFEENLTTVATINRDRRIVGGGGYSGCLYSVYRVGNGEYKCFHTARPGGVGVNSDQYVNLLRSYAAAQNWILIHEVPTVGEATVGGCVTVFILTRVSYTINPVMVRTVRLSLDAQGMSVRRQRWNTPG
jgi:hypothetical protein